MTNETFFKTQKKKKITNLTNMTHYPQDAYYTSNHVPTVLTYAPNTNDVHPQGVAEIVYSKQKRKNEILKWNELEFIFLRAREICRA